MARRSPPQIPASRRGVVSFRWKLIAALSASLCVLALFSIYHRESRPVRSRIPLQKYSGERPKMAFLFLARHDLPLDFLWDRFFKVDHPFHSIPFPSESLIIFLLRAEMRGTCQSMYIQHLVSYSIKAPLDHTSSTIAS